MNQFPTYLFRIIPNISRERSNNVKSITVKRIFFQQYFFLSVMCKGRKLDLKIRDSLSLEASI